MITMASYSLKMVYRNRNLLISAFLAILIGLSFLFSAFMIVDYLGQASVKEELSDIKIDITVRLYDPRNYLVRNYEYYLRKVKSINNIRDAVPLMQFSIYNGNITFGNNTYSSLGYHALVFSGIEPERSSELFTKITGEITENPYEIAVLSSIASELGISVGDNISVQYVTVDNEIRNISLKVSAIVQPSEKFYDLIQYRYASNVIYSPIMPSEMNEIFAIFGSIKSLRQIYSDLTIKRSAQVSTWEMYFFIYLDRDNLINIWNLDETMNKLDEIMEDLGFTFMGTAPWADIRNNVYDKIMEINSNMQVQKFYVIYYYWPIVLIGIVLSSIGLLTTMKSRKPVIALLKVKGASNSHVRKMMLLEGLINGLIAGTGSIFLSYLLAVLICVLYFPHLVATYDPFSLLFNKVLSYAVPLVATALIIGFITVYSPSKSIAKLEIIDALYEYTEYIEKEETGISKWIWILTGIGLYSVIEISFGFPVYWILLSTSMRYFLLSFLLMIVLVLDIISMVIGPILFAYAVSKLLAHYFGKISDTLAKLTNRLTGELSYLSLRGLERKSKRFVRALFLIQLVVIFSVFYLVNEKTLYNRGIIEAKMNVGSDVRIMFSNDVPYRVIMNVTKSLSNISGIDKVIKVGISPLIYHYSQGTANIFLIDLDYFDLKFFESDYLSGARISEIRNALNNTNQILFSYAIKQMGILSKGDEILLRNMINNSLISARVAGFIKFAPGLARHPLLPGGIIAFQTYLVAGFTSFNAIMKVFNVSSENIRIYSLLIQLSGDANVAESLNKIKGVLFNYSLPYTMKVFRDEVKKINSVRISNLSYHLSGVEVVSSVIMGIIGVILIVFSMISEERREIALLRSKGASRIQIIRLFIAEITLINIIAFSAGVINGLIYSFAELSAPISLMHGPARVDYPQGYLMTIPFNVPLFIITAFITIIIASLIPVIMNLRRNLGEELRIYH